MKVLITFEDKPTEENAHNVSIGFDFDPPLEEDTEMSAAGFLATEVMKIVSKNLEEEDSAGDLERRIVLANP